MRDDVPRARGNERPAAPGGARGHRDLRAGGHQAHPDHGRPRAHRGSRGPRARRAQAGAPGDGRRARRDERRAAPAPGRRDRGLRPRFARPQAARRRRLAGSRSLRRDDRRRRQRRPGPQEGGHRRRHGHHRDGRHQGRRGHDAHRRQLRLDRGRGRGGAWRLQQHQEVPDVPALVERRRDRADGGSLAPGHAAARSPRCRSCTSTSPRTACPALALAVDPPEADLMRRPPRDPQDRHLHAAGPDPDHRWAASGRCWSTSACSPGRWAPAAA